MTSGALPLATRPVHLGLGATAVPQPEFDGAFAWYEDYAHRTQRDGAEGRLVAMHRFTQNWESWEMHPAGDEVVVCVSGAMVLTQERPDGAIERIALREGEYAINPAGVWHTADVATSATALFITAGQGTDHRPR